MAALIAAAFATPVVTAFCHCDMRCPVDVSEEQMDWMEALFPCGDEDPSDPDDEDNKPVTTDMAHGTVGNLDVAVRLYIVEGSTNMTGHLIAGNESGWGIVHSSISRNVPAGTNLTDPAPSIFGNISVTSDESELEFIGDETEAFEYRAPFQWRKLPGFGFEFADVTDDVYLVLYSITVGNETLELELAFHGQPSPEPAPPPAPAPGPAPAVAPGPAPAPPIGDDSESPSTPSLLVLGTFGALLIGIQLARSMRERLRRQ